MTPPHISPLFNHQKQSKVTFAIRCTNRKHLYPYTSVTYALFSYILPEKACFLLRIFVSLHRQSKEQPSCAKSRSSMTTEAGLNRWQAPVINEDHKNGQETAFWDNPNTAYAGTFAVGCFKVDSCKVYHRFYYFFGYKYSIKNEVGENIVTGLANRNLLLKIELKWTLGKHFQ